MSVLAASRACGERGEIQNPVMTTAGVSPTQELPQPFPREDENQSPLGRKGLRSHLIASASMQAPVQATQQEAIPFYKLACLQVTYCLTKPELSLKSWAARTPFQFSSSSPELVLLHALWLSFPGAVFLVTNPPWLPSSLLSSPWLMGLIRIKTLGCVFCLKPA